MSRRVGWICGILMLGLCLPGCGLMGSAKSVTQDSVKSVKVRPGGYRDMTNEVEDEWTSVGRTASTMRGVEKEDDQWLRNLMFSPKAISIERNLGIE